MRLILAGFGTVGQAFAELVIRKEDELISTYGFAPRVVAVADSSGWVSDERGMDLGKLLARKRRTRSVGQRKAGMESFLDLLTSADADVLVESTPTNIVNGRPGLDYIRAAFVSKKHVITSNKGPLAVAFQALQELARHNGVQFRYSGAVGGGTPVLDFGRSCSIGDDITRVSGILNGTSNFILTKMEQDAVDFETALARAQEEGYAERDPTLDVGGLDAAVKLSIIANHLGLRRATISDVRVRGISEVSLAEVKGALAHGKALRLVATADGGLSVGPTVIPRDDPLCVSGAYNAVKFECRYSGPKIIVGKGAGGPETAASLLRDLIEIREAVSSSQESGS